MSLISTEIRTYRLQSGAYVWITICYIDFNQARLLCGFVFCVFLFVFVSNVKVWFKAETTRCACVWLSFFFFFDSVAHTLHALFYTEFFFLETAAMILCYAKRQTKGNEKKNRKAYSIQFKLGKFSPYEMRFGAWIIANLTNFGLLQFAFASLHWIRFCWRFGVYLFGFFLRYFDCV